jgi:hypothetical protein
VHVLEFLPAEVVASSLHVADVERPENRLQKGHILVEQLLLQTLRPGRQNDSPAGNHRETQRRIDVRERLACAGPGLYNEVCALDQRLLNTECHLELARPILEAEPARVGQYSGRRKELSHAGHGHSSPLEGSVLLHTARLYYCHYFSC